MESDVLKQQNENDSFTVSLLYGILTHDLPLAVNSSFIMNVKINIIGYVVRWCSEDKADVSEA